MSGRSIEELTRKNILASTVGIGCRPNTDKYISLAKGRQVDYSAIEQGISNARKEGVHSLDKVKGIKRKNNELKEKRLDSQHFDIWEAQAKLLLKEFTKLEVDLEQFYFFLLERDLEVHKPFVQNVKLSEEEFNEEYNTFINDIVDPVKELSCDVKLTVIEHAKCQKAFEVKHSSAMKEEISRVNTRSIQILNQLNEEFEEYMEFVENICNKYHLTGDYSNCISLDEIQNIPVEIIVLDWPDEFSLLEVTQEYQEVIASYLNKFEHLEDKYVSQKHRDFPLTNYDLEKAKFIMSQYVDTSIANRRKLLLDRLEKEFPLICKFELRKLSTWHFSLEAYEHQKKLLIKSFLNSKTQFITKTKLHNQEAWTSYQEGKEENLAKEQRKKERLEFLTKLRDWKMKRLDILRMENELALKESEEMEVRQREEEAEKSKVANDKRDRVLLFQKERRIHEEQQRAEIQILLDRARKELANQIERDKEKVDKRRKCYEDKIETRKMKKFENKETNLRKQELQLLITQKISDNFAHNPERIHLNTKAYNAKIETSKHIQDLQTPLFKVDTFTSDVVTADPRVRLEMALRSAGLHNTLYAKEAMKSVLPLKQPKPELKSSIFPSEEHNRLY